MMIPFKIAYLVVVHAVAGSGLDFAYSPVSDMETCLKVLEKMHTEAGENSKVTVTAYCADEPPVYVWGASFGKANGVETKLKTK